MKLYNLLLLLIISLSGILMPRDFDHRDIPIHENGRIKPLDTLVRNQLLLIYGKRSIKSNALPDELNSKGFLLANFDKLIIRARTGSLWPMKKIKRKNIFNR